MNNKVAIYCRTSTTEQSTDNQLPVLKKFTEQRAWQLIEIYQEQETAWKSGHQEELARLKADASKHQFDIVLVWSLDRLSRQGAASILNLVNTFKAYGVRIISYQEAWTEAPGEMGELLYAVAGWVARMESQRISERTKAGVERARKFGTKSGRGIGQRGKDTVPRKRSGYFRRFEK